jgi:hypothetical protein
MTENVMDFAPFRAGRVMSKSFSILFRNLAPFLLLALVISSPTYVYHILSGPPDFLATGDPADFSSLIDTTAIVVGVIGLLLGYLVMAALVYGTMRDLKNEPVALGDCFAKGVRVIFPVLGVAFVALLILALVVAITLIPGAILVGVLFAGSGAEWISAVLIPVFFIPAGYVWVILWVTIPVAVIERRGLGSLKRSRELTKGFRWRIIGLLILLLGIGLGVGLLLEWFNQGFFGDAGVSTAAFAGRMASEWIISGFFSALSAVIVAVSYHDLRVAKEGVDTDQIASVFD